MPVRQAKQIIWAVLSCAMGLAMGGGCASAKNPDPLERPNRLVYRVNDKLDRVVLKPASDLYVKVVPPRVRTAVGNAFDNLSYVNVALNDLLQGEIGQGLGAAGRMAVNTTVGVVGLFDVATGWGMPAHENDFGLTLGKWGAKPGAYLVLPLLGPSSVRDVPGLVVARLTNPLHWLDPPAAVSISLGVTDVLDSRARADTQIKVRDRAALDPYLFTRDAYLQHRRALLGEPPTPVDEGFYEVHETGETYDEVLVK